MNTPHPPTPPPPNTPNSFDRKLEGGKEGEAPPQPPYPPNTPNSFDRKLEGRKEGEAPPNPPTQTGQRARHLRSSLRPVYVCGGGGISSSRGRGWDARQIFATNRDDP